MSNAPDHKMTRRLSDKLSSGLTSRIAPEIYDKIIDSFHSSKYSLSACSLVCKSWLPTCRYHLFFNVTLSPKLVEFLCSSPHAITSVTPYIRNVAFGGTWSMAQRNEYDAVSILLNLDGVCGLALEIWNWGYLDPRSAATLLKAEGSVFKNVTKVHLKNTRFPSFPLLTTFLAGFSAMEDLSFHNVSWDLVEKNPTPRLTALEGSDRPFCPSQLKELRVVSSLLKPILCWIFGEEIGCAESSIPALRLLAIPEVLQSDLNMVGSILRGLGSSLCHLEVGFVLHIDDKLCLKGSYLFNSLIDKR